MITAELVRELLDYDPDTGVFRWRRKSSPFSHVEPGAVAGGCDAQGYRMIRVAGRKHRAHRLAWLYVHGEWPAHTIDHINGARDDNRIANLRDVTHAENLQNLRSARADNRSTGRLGVDIHNGRYRARIHLNGESHYLGYFSTADEASAAYREAKRRMHPFSVVA